MDHLICPRGTKDLFVQQSVLQDAQGLKRIRCAAENPSLAGIDVLWSVDAGVAELSETSGPSTVVTIRGPIDAVRIRAQCVGEDGTAYKTVDPIWVYWAVRPAGWMTLDLPDGATYPVVFRALQLGWQYAPQQTDWTLQWGVYDPVTGTGIIEGAQPNWGDSHSIGSPPALPYNFGTPIAGLGGCKVVFGSVYFYADPRLMPVGSSYLLSCVDGYHASFTDHAFWTANAYQTSTTWDQGQNLITAVNGIRVDRIAGTTPELIDLSMFMVRRSANSNLQYSLIDRTAVSTTPGTQLNSPLITDSDATITLAADPWTTIYYTTDGSTPTVASTAYTGPFTVAAGSVIQAIATAVGWLPSNVASYTVPVTHTPLVLDYIAAGADASAGQLVALDTLVLALQADGTLGKLLRLSIPLGTTLTTIAIPLINTKGAPTDTYLGDLSYADYTDAGGVGGINRGPNAIDSGATHLANELGGCFIWTAGANNSTQWYRCGTRELGGAERSITSNGNAPFGISYWGWAQTYSVNYSGGNINNGLTHLEVSGAYHAKIYQDGTLVNNDTTTYNLGPRTDHFLFGKIWIAAVGTPGGTNTFGAGRILCFGLTDGTMSDSQAATLHTALAAFMVAIGRA